MLDMLRHERTLAVPSSRNCILPEPQPRPIPYVVIRLAVVEGCTGAADGQHYRGQAI